MKLTFLVSIICLMPNIKYVLLQQPHDVKTNIPVVQLQLKDQVGEGQSNKLDMSFTLPSCIERDETCLFEDIGEFLEGTAPGIVHEPLQSIPSHRRIPHHMANNQTYILERYNLPKDRYKTALYDYNPVLLPLYRNRENGTLASDLHIELLDHLTGRYHPDFSNADADQVKYLAISRIDSIHSCGPSIRLNFSSREKKGQNYLGLSLLDENLTAIKGADVAINIGLWILRQDRSYDFMDFYIYSARTTKGLAYKDQLFLAASGQTSTFLFPFDVRRVPQSASVSASPNKTLYSHFDDSWNTKVKGSPIPMDNDEMMYGTGLQVRFMDDLRDKKRNGGLLYHKGPGLDTGKNYHFFESSNGTTFIENWPKSPHRTRPINFFASVFASYKDDVNYFPGRIMKGKSTEYPQKEIQNNARSEPTTSFKSHRVMHVKDRFRDRGTSCCVDMTLNGNQQVKVGIIHGKVKPRAYLSKFYAFHPDPPFEIFASTGWFCLGHMREDDIGFASQWISQRTHANRTAPILVEGAAGITTCPAVSFASGITEMIGHRGENIIISYGLNDCYSRSLIVPKKKIELLLLGKQQVKNK